MADSTFAIADSLRGRRPPPPSVSVMLTEVAPGFFHVTGGSHHSLAVVQGDSIVLLEAPRSSARIRAVLDTLRSRFPRTPVRLVVNTHHHWDHASGVRGALAAGIPVLSFAGNAAFVRAMVGEGGAQRVRSVRDSVAIGRGENRLVVHVATHSHTEGLLVTYAPGPKLLFVADAAPSGLRYSQAELVDWVRARGLDVERLVGAHGAVTAWTELERAITAR